MTTEEAIGSIPIITMTEPARTEPLTLPAQPMSNIVPLAPQGAPAANYSFMPTTLDEAVRLSQFLAKSTIVPKHFVDQPANVFVAMQWGAELSLRPLQALQNIAVINGKPGLYGDAGKALLLANGCQIQEDDGETIRQNGYARCTITRRGRPPVTRSFSLEDAKVAGLLGKDGPWKTYPQRQLAWRAFWFAARDAAADILRGMSGAEELADYEPRHEPERPRVEPPKPKRATEPEAPAADVAATTPASASMISHIFKRLANAKLEVADMVTAFPGTPESLEGITVAQANAILKWTATPAGG